jgi:hypothetical protein
MNVPELQNLNDLEKMVMDYIDVIDRTRKCNTDVLPLVDASVQAVLLKDNEVLLDMRNRIWKQFAPVLVDTVN